MEWANCVAGKKMKEFCFPRKFDWSVAYTSAHARTSQADILHVDQKAA